jgi:putative membrane protein
MTLVVRLSAVISPLILVTAQSLAGSATLAGLAPAEAAVVAAAYCYAVAAWFRFRFRISQDGVELSSGLLLRQHRSAAASQVRAVDVTRPLLSRLLGLAELQVRVAGGHGAHLRLRYLRLADVHRYRAVLLTAAGIDAIEQGEPLAAVSPRRLALATLLTMPTLGGGLLVIAGSIAPGASGRPAGTALVLLWSYGYLTALYRRYQRFSGFKLTRTSAGLRISQGFSDTLTQTISPERIMAARMTAPPLWRLAGLARVEASAAGQHLAGYGERMPRLVLLPAGPPAEARLLVERVLGCDLAAAALAGPPRQARWLRPVGLRMLAAGSGGGVTVVRRGLLRELVDVVPARGIESARIVQGPAQRRLGLVTVILDCVRGPARPRARHLDPAAARRLLDPAPSPADGSRPDQSLVDRVQSGRPCEGAIHHRLVHGIHPRHGVQLGEDVAQMPLDGLLSNAELTGDLRVGKRLGNQLEDLLLPAGQQLVRGSCGGAGSSGLVTSGEHHQGRLVAGVHDAKGEQEVLMADAGGEVAAHPKPHHLADEGRFIATAEQDQPGLRHDPGDGGEQGGGGIGRFVQIDNDDGGQGPRDYFG